MSGRFLTVRFLRLPAKVFGPQTRWVVTLDYGGKNGNKAVLIANCLTNGKSVTLIPKSRAALVEGRAQVGFDVRIGTVACKIISAAVAQGSAEFVAEGEACTI